MGGAAHTKDHGSLLPTAGAGNQKYGKARLSSTVLGWNRLECELMIRHVNTDVAIATTWMDTNVHMDTCTCISWFSLGAVIPQAGKMSTSSTQILVSKYHIPLIGTRALQIISSFQDWVRKRRR